MKKTYITSMPDRAGALLQASTIIKEEGGSIVRVNYHKAVDLHTLFIEVSAKKEQIHKITERLSDIGYLSDPEPQRKVMLFEIKPSDVTGDFLDILEILDKYDINICYINFQNNTKPSQKMKMGLYIEKPDVIKKLLDELSTICDIKIIDYSITEKILDSTVFYLSFADEMKTLLDLSKKDTSRFIVESNKIMQFLENRNEKPFKTFEYIRKFAKFIVEHKGKAFKPVIEERQLTPKVHAWIIEPPCGSNTYILDDSEELLFIDGGFQCFIGEMQEILKDIVPDFENRKKRMLLTHADIDHVGLLPLFDEILVSDNCRINLELDYNGEDDFREQNPFHNPYCHISKLISGYTAPEPSKLKVIGTKKDCAVLSHIGSFVFGDLEFELFEGNGGHVRGETIIFDMKKKIIFTGDNLVNIKGFSRDQMTFNALAPYLMTSVNVDSKEANRSRNLLLEWAKGSFVCPGHGIWEQY